MEIFEDAVRIPGAWFTNRWCDQEVLDLAGAKTAAEAAGGYRNSEE